jgi:hypothetical protein
VTDTLYSQARTRYGVVVSDPHGVQTIKGWYDTKTEATAVVLEKFAGSAHVITASGIVGHGADHKHGIRSGQSSE